MTLSSEEPEPRPVTKEAWQLEKELLRAVADDDIQEALSVMRRIEELTHAHPWCGVVGTYLAALGILGRIAGRGGVPDIATLTRRVQDLAEPWFDADADGFMEVAYESRNRALHTLMYAAGRAGELDVAIAIRRADDAGNARADARWARDYPLNQAAPVFLPSAWGARGLIQFLAEGQRFDALPEFLGNLEHYLDATRGGRDNQETRDALGEAEAEALAIVLAAETLPAALKSRCLARAAALAALAVPLSDWPRTRKVLAELIGPACVH